MKSCEIKGIIPPILTPMNNDQEQTVNHQELRNQVERLLRGGVHGLFPFGTNGEGYILSLKEKEAVLETVIDQVKGRVPVYAGTGCISTEVAKHVNIPIVLYNIPMRTGNKLLPETVEKLARDVDVIMGAKDSSGDRENLKAYIDRTRDLGKPFSVLAGNDGNILYCLENGGTGGIAGRANLWPATVASIYDHFVAGDLDKAREAQEAIAKIQPVFKFGNPNTIIKKAVSLMGYPVGDCRRPFSYLCDEGLEALKQVLEETKNLG